MENDAIVALVYATKGTSLIFGTSLIMDAILYAQKFLNEFPEVRSLCLNVPIEF